MRFLASSVVSTLVSCSFFFALSSCGDKKDDVPIVTASPTPKNSAADQIPEKDQRTVDLKKLAAPCHEDEEDTARIISVDNVSVVQFCRNREWGNPYFEASSMRCMDLGFQPLLTEDKRGVSCRNASNAGSIVSLNTQWAPSGRGLEACDTEEFNKWHIAFDRDGVKVALRCTEMGRFDGLQPKTRFKCADADQSYKLVLINDGEGVACRRDDNQQQIYSLFTAQLGTYLSNANCPKLDQWEYYKSREGRLCAGKCDAYDDQVPGIFINQNSPGSNLCCPINEVPEILSDKSSASCKPL